MAVILNKLGLVKLALIGLIFLCASVFFPLALAQESSPATIAPSPTPVEYALPYPGILPDHPLYIFKQLRDSVLGLLIRSPLRRVEYQQLLTDKYVNMGVHLLQQDKDRLAIVTFERAEQSLLKTQDYIAQLPASEADAIGNAKERYKKSLQKYTEVLEKAKPQVDAELAGKIDTILATITTLRQAQ